MSSRKGVLCRGGSQAVTFNGVIKPQLLCARWESGTAVNERQILNRGCHLLLSATMNIKQGDRTETGGKLGLAG